MKEKYTPKEFIVFKHDSGQINFVKRDLVSCFQPLFTHPRGYNIVAHFGNEKAVVNKVDTVEEAENWCLEQIAMIEEDSPRTRKEEAKKLEEARKKANE